MKEGAYRLVVFLTVYVNNVRCMETFCHILLVYFLCSSLVALGE